MSPRRKLSDVTDWSKEPNSDALLLRGLLRLLAELLAVREEKEKP